MDLLSNFDNMDVVLGDENSNPIERELAIIINGSVGQNDTEVLSNNTGNSSQENEITDFNVKKEIPRQDRLVESMENFSNEMIVRLFQEIDSLMSSQINRAVSSAIHDRVTLEMQNIMRTLSSGQRDTESGASVNNQDSSEEANGLKTNSRREGF